MKKITITLIVLILFAPLLSVIIETNDGRTIKGSFIKKQESRYTIKAATGDVVIFEEEIQRALSDTGTDITETFLAMTPEPVLEPLPRANPVALSNIDVISRPLWVLTVSTIAFYIYSVFNMEETKKISKKKTNIGDLLP
jgi:hypothetical protein